MFTQKIYVIQKIRVADYRIFNCGFAHPRLINTERIIENFY